MGELWGEQGVVNAGLHVEHQGPLGEKQKFYPPGHIQQRVLLHHLPFINEELSHQAVKKRFTSL